MIEIPDSYPGFPVHYFSITPRYEGYIDSVLIPHGMLLDRIEKLALDIITYSEQMNIQSVTLLCVLKGGFKFLADLIRQLESIVRARGSIIQFSIDFVRAKSYINTQSGKVKLEGVENPEQYKHKNLLVVEDIIDTGKTMTALVSYLESLSPNSLQVASLLVKRTKASNGYKPKFAGFEIPDRFIVGYAFDYNDHFRDMNHICVMNKKGQDLFSLPFGST